MALLQHLRSQLTNFPSEAGERLHWTSPSASGSWSIFVFAGFHVPGVRAAHSVAWTCFGPNSKQAVVMRAVHPCPLKFGEAQNYCASFFTLCNARYKWFVSHFTVSDILTYSKLLRTLKMSQVAGPYLSQDFSPICCMHIAPRVLAICCTSPVSIVSSM